MSTGGCETARCSIWRSTASYQGCDLVKIKIGDVISGGSIRNRSTVIQQKTGTPVQLKNV